LDQKPEGKKGIIRTSAEIAEKGHCDPKLEYTVCGIRAFSGTDQKKAGNSAGATQGNPARWKQK
jgi:hypothetical protein